MASKFLTLAESVRDAADLYLSLKYPPPVFISDSPCGFARHMECRVPDITDIVWGENYGCFEKPEFGRHPNVSILSIFNTSTSIKQAPLGQLYFRVFTASVCLDEFQAYR